MKARCCHGVRWFIVCPWCKSEADAAAYREGFQGQFAFWRNMTPEQAAREVERAPMLLRIHALMDRALEQWGL